MRVERVSLGDAIQGVGREMNDEAIKEVIRSRQIRTIFQPIVNLSDLSIVGFEALSRGPANSELESARALFKGANRARLHGQLEQLCRSEAFWAADGQPSSCKLFLKVSAPSLRDSDLSESPGSVHGIEGPAIGPHQVVLELSERYAVSDNDWLRDAVRSLSARGFEFALDNMGSGHNSLNRVVDVRPRFIKLDRSIVQNLHQSAIDMETVASYQTVTRRRPSAATHRCPRWPFEPERRARRSSE